MNRFSMTTRRKEGVSYSYMSPYFVSGNVKLCLKNECKDINLSEYQYISVTPLSEIILHKGNPKFDRNRYVGGNDLRITPKYNLFARYKIYRDSNNKTNVFKELSSNIGMLTYMLEKYDTAYLKELKWHISDIIISNYDSDESLIHSFKVRKNRDKVSVMEWARQ